MCEDTWIVAGLGNPGPRYSGTRHDIGFALVARLARQAGVELRRLPDAEVAGPAGIPRPGDGGPAGGKGAGQESGGEGRTGQEGEGPQKPSVLFVRPCLFMNRSGPPLVAVMRARGVAPSRLLIACDDVNLPLGHVRLRAKGSSGGHRGLESIIEVLGEGFPRLRMGVGGAPPGEDLAGWVLAPFGESELQAVEGMLRRGGDLVWKVIVDGVVRPTTSAPVSAAG